jgi:hypothetical protein
LKKVKIAFYGLPDCYKGYIRAVRRTRQFTVEVFQDLPEGASLSGPNGPLSQISKFNPHILVIRHPGDAKGLRLARLFNRHNHFLLVVLSVFAEDQHTVATLKKAGVREWQIFTTAITDKSFAERMVDFKKKHIIK